MPTYSEVKEDKRRKRLRIRQRQIKKKVSGNINGRLFLNFLDVTTN